MNVKRKRSASRTRRYMAAVAAGLLMLGASMPVRASGSASPVIDGTKSASLTLFKLKENDGAVKDGNGRPDSSVHAPGMKGIRFMALRIGRLVTAAGDSEIGLYITDLDDGFAALCSRNGVRLSSESVEGQVSYTTEALSSALTELSAAAGAVPGDVQVQNYVRDNSAALAMPLTDESGRTQKEGLPLGLYLIAETDYSAYSESGTAEETVSNPSSPFLVLLPMSNQDGEAADHWVYDVTAYPKNQTVSVPKYIVKESDGKSLVQSDDFEIGETVHQLIAPSAPAVLRPGSTSPNHRNYEEYVITDTMEAGLSFVRVTSVRLGPRVSAPKTTDAFKDFSVLKEGEDYRVLKGPSGTQPLNESNAKGTKIFRVEFLSAGIRKLNEQQSGGQAAVFFDAVVTSDAKDGWAEPNTNKPSLMIRHTNTVRTTFTGNEPRVFSYRLNVQKKGVRDMSAVLFSVRRDDRDVLFIKERDGLYHLLDHDQDQTAMAVRELQVGADGKMVIRGLDADTYTFTERRTEKGHELLASTFTVALKGSDNTDGTLSEAVLTTEGKSTRIAIEKGTAGFIVRNRTSFVLRTGGAGVLILYLLSGAGVAAAALFALRGRKRR